MSLSTLKRRAPRLLTITYSAKRLLPHCLASGLKIRNRTEKTAAEVFQFVSFKCNAKVRICFLSLYLHVFSPLSGPFPLYQMAFLSRPNWLLLHIFCTDTRTASVFSSNKVNKELFKYTNCSLCQQC